MEIRKNYFDFYIPEERKIIIEDWEKSGLNMSAYCRQKRIPIGSFYEWRCKFTPSSCTNLKEIRDKWKKHIEDWQKSGLSKRDYCKGKELLSEVLSQWDKKLNPPTPRKTALEKWTEIVEDWKKSDLEKAVYCRKKKLNPTSFYKWEKKINSSKSSQSLSDLTREPQSQFGIPLNGSFIPLELSSTISKSSSSTNPKIEVMLSQGHRFCLEGPFDWENFSSWLTPLLTTKD